MTKLGHIEIGKEVLFVYYELPKPQEKAFVLRLTIGRAAIFKQRDWVQALKEYEASKREVKAENVFWDELVNLWHIKGNVSMHDFTIVRNNQPCEAEITDGKAMITKIT